MRQSPQINVDISLIKCIELDKTKREIFDLLAFNLHTFQDKRNISACSEFLLYIQCESTRFQLQHKRKHIGLTKYANTFKQMFTCDANKEVNVSTYFSF